MGSKIPLLLVMQLRSTINCGVLSGIPCFNYQLDNYAYNVAFASGPTASIGDCQSKCQTFGNCLFFSWSNGNCYPKYSKAGTLTAPNTEGGSGFCEGKALSIVSRSLKICLALGNFSHCYIDTFLFQVDRGQIVILHKKAWSRAPNHNVVETS